MLHRQALRAHLDGTTSPGGRRKLRILIIEDDAQNRDYLVKALGDAGHDVDSTGNGVDGLDSALAKAHDVLIVDRMVPDLDGLSIVKAARRAGVTTPVLMLTALSAISDRVEGLESGADDYLVKPFTFAELSARVNALARRSALKSDETRIVLGNLTMDRMRRVVSCGGTIIDLQPREFQLLELLALNAGRVVTRAMLLEQVWGFRFDPGTNIIETHMSRLRSKLSDGESTQIIHTVRGKGYVIREPY